MQVSLSCAERQLDITCTSDTAKAVRTWRPGRACEVPAVLRGSALASAGSSERSDPTPDAARRMGRFRSVPVAGNGRDGSSTRPKACFRQRLVTDP